MYILVHVQEVVYVHVLVHPGQCMYIPVYVHIQYYNIYFMYIYLYYMYVHTQYIHVHVLIHAYIHYTYHYIDSLISQLCPMMKRCLGKEENYDLRMDTALVSSHVGPSIYPLIHISIYMYMCLSFDLLIHR